MDETNQFAVLAFGTQSARIDADMSDGDYAYRIPTIDRKTEALGIPSEHRLYGYIQDQLLVAV